MPRATSNTEENLVTIAEQLAIMAAHGAAEDGFRKEHGGNGEGEPPAAWNLEEVRPEERSVDDEEGGSERSGAQA